MSKKYFGTDGIRGKVNQELLLKIQDCLVMH